MNNFKVKGCEMMKELTLTLTDDQVEILDNISNRCGKSSSEFIRDTVFSILPLNEYIAIKRYLGVVDKMKSKKGNTKAIQEQKQSFLIIYKHNLQEDIGWILDKKMVL